MTCTEHKRLTEEKKKEIINYWEKCLKDAQLKTIKNLEKNNISNLEIGSLMMNFAARVASNTISSFKTDGDQEKTHKLLVLFFKDISKRLNLNLSIKLVEEEKNNEGMH